MNILTTRFCKSLNSDPAISGADSDNHLYINKFNINEQNIPNSLFAFRKVRIFSIKIMKIINNYM